MTRQRLFLLGLGVALAAAGSARADTPSAPAADAAHTAWAVTELVLDKHIDPPSRQEMLLFGVRALFAAPETTRPADLSRRVSRVTTEAEFAALVKDLWPQAAAGKKVDVKALEERMVRGVLWPAPGKARLYPPQEYRVQEQITNNRYEGTGIQVKVHSTEKLVQVVSAFPNGPARRAGMKADDLFEEVDGVSTHGKSLPEVVQMLRGRVGEPLTVVVRQAGSTEKRTLKMVREVVPFETVVGYRRTGETSWDYRPSAGDPIAFVRIRNVTSSAVSELRKIEQRVKEAGCKALVLDLRFSISGDVQKAGLLADALLDGGLMYRLHDTKGVKDVRADRDCLFRGWPIVVLINDQTGGTCADVVAAALKDTKRATLVGERTGGDGYVKTFHEAPGGLGMLWLATASVSRAAPARPAAEDPEGLDAVPPYTWVVRPDHVVHVERKQAGAAEEWLNSQERPELAGKAGKPPEDAQLVKALELLRAALKEPSRS